MSQSGYNLGKRGVWFGFNKHKVRGKLPHEDEEWRWREVPIDDGTLQELSNNDLIERVDHSPPAVWTSTPKLCGALRQAYSPDACISLKEARRQVAEDGGQETLESYS